jgi:hypothetical protein
MARFGFLFVPHQVSYFLTRLHTIGRLADSLVHRQSGRPFYLRHCSPHRPSQKWRSPSCVEPPFSRS